jgi:hypothetical protein
MSENENTRAYRQGIQHERDRIIKLLETYDFGPTTIPSVLKWNMNLRHILKLIKGEDK